MSAGSRLCGACIADGSGRAVLRPTGESRLGWCEYSAAECVWRGAVCPGRGVGCWMPMKTIAQLPAVKEEPECATVHGGG